MWSKINGFIVSIETVMGMSHFLHAGLPQMESAFIPVVEGGGGGGDSAYERGGDGRWKFWIKPLKETDLGMAQAFFDP